MQSTEARLCSTRGSFCGAVLGQSAQILSGQRLLIPLSHAVDRGSPVLHVREFLWSGPWAVSSNFQPTGLAHPLVTCSRLRLACAPHEGGYEKGVRSASQGFAHILPRTASLIPMSCHMREINPTNHSLSSHSPPNQTPCMLPFKLFPSDTFQESAFYFTHFPHTIDWEMVPLLLSRAQFNMPITLLSLGKKNKWNKINLKNSF